MPAGERKWKNWTHMHHRHKEEMYLTSAKNITMEQQTIAGK